MVSAPSPGQTNTWPCAHASIDPERQASPGWMAGLCPAWIPPHRGTDLRLSQTATYRAALSRGPHSHVHGSAGALPVRPSGAWRSDAAERQVSPGWMAGLCPAWIPLRRGTDLRLSQTATYRAALSRDRTHIVQGSAGALVQPGAWRSGAERQGFTWLDGRALPCLDSTAHRHDLPRNGDLPHGRQSRTALTRSRQRWSAAGPAKRELGAPTRRGRARLARPSSEPDVRISRIRLSGRWSRSWLTEAARAVSRLNRPLHVKKSFGHIRWARPYGERWPRRRFRST